MGEHEPRKMNEGVCLCQARCRAVGWKLRAVIHVHTCSPRLSPSGRGELRPGGREGPRRRARSRTHTQASARTRWVRPVWWVPETQRPEDVQVVPDANPQTFPGGSGVGTHQGQMKRRDEVTMFIVTTLLRKTSAVWMVFRRAVARQARSRSQPSQEPPCHRLDTTSQSPE